MEENLGNDRNLDDTKNSTNELSGQTTPITPIPESASKDSVSTTIPISPNTPSTSMEASTSLSSSDNIASIGTVSNPENNKLNNTPISNSAELGAEVQKPTKKSKKGLLIGAFVGLLVIALAVGGFAFLKKDKTSINSASGSLSGGDNVSTIANGGNVLQGIKFSGNLKPTESITLFSDTGMMKYYNVDSAGLTEVKSRFKFYEIGTTDGGGRLVLMQLDAFGPGDPPLVLAHEQGDKYKLMLTYLRDLQDPVTGQYVGPELLSNVEADTKTEIPELAPKDTISYNGIVASSVPNNFPKIISPDANTKLTEVAKIDQGVVYEQVFENSHHAGVKMLSILLKQPTGLYLVYRYTTDILKDDNSVSITYKDGKTVTEKYSWAMVKAGCGVVDSVNVVDKTYFNDLVEIGKAGSEPIYGFKSASHQAVSTIYQTYNMDGQRKDAVSQEQFWKDNGVVVVRNKLGYRVVLVSDKYQAMGECGKPVIYLYPTEKTDLSVKVGADVTVSDPAYNTGWGVTAYPDGRIFNKKDSKTYPYLFWEGQGHGLYPSINEGFVVKRSEVEKTMKKHLALLGLNQQESKDFMEFWTLKLPNKPYIRLTWFGTEQMDRLAPLNLSVKPDTSIRIFLDFQGLDKPIKLKPQRLTHKEREGFVLVEWGGLLYVY